MSSSVDLAQSYMIGDKLIDLECGWNAGVKKCLLVRTGYGAAVERASADKLGAAAVVDDLPAAAQWILESNPDPRWLRGGCPRLTRKRKAMNHVWHCWIHWQKGCSAFAH